MSLSVRSAIPTEHSIPKLSAFALMYGVRKPVTSVVNPRYERGSSAAIKGTMTAIVIAESVTRSRQGIPRSDHRSFGDALAPRIDDEPLYGLRRHTLLVCNGCGSRAATADRHRRVLRHDRLGLLDPLRGAGGLLTCCQAHQVERPHDSLGRSPARRDHRGARS
mgnify:CR=1 FL=1